MALMSDVFYQLTTITFVKEYVFSKFFQSEWHRRTTIIHKKKVTKQNGFY